MNCPEQRMPAYAGHPRPSAHPKTERTGSRRLRWWQALCLVLHALLHVALLVVGIMQLERKLVFSISEQTIVSFAVTTISQSFGITYLASTACVILKLALHRSIHARETLTAMHDSLASWNGLGSFLATFYSQFSIPASVSAVLTVTVSCMHLDPANIYSSIFSVNAFHSTRPSETRALPSLDRVAASFLLPVTEFLPWMYSLPSSQTLGLLNNSIYNTLQDLPGDGFVQVDATAFNLMRGPPCSKHNYAGNDTGHWNISLGASAGSSTSLTFVPPRVHVSQSILVKKLEATISSLYWSASFPSGQSPTAQLGPFSNISQAVQFLFCTRTLVEQRGIVAGASGQLDASTLDPVVYKTISAWVGLPSAFSVHKSRGQQWCPGNEYECISHGPSWPRPITASYDHDIENALAAELAAAFWIVGHIKLDELTTAYGGQNANQGAYLARPVVGVKEAVLSGATTLVVRLEVIWLFCRHPTLYIGLRPQFQQMRSCRSKDSSRFNCARNKRKKDFDRTWYGDNDATSAGEILFSVVRPPLIPLRRSRRIPSLVEHLADFCPFALLPDFGACYTPPHHCKRTPRARYYVFSRCQESVSFWISVTSTSISMIIANKGYLGSKRTLSAAHDELGSWGGIGAALSSVLNQWSLPASLTGTICIFGYLGVISILHVTIPAQLAVETFKLSTGHFTQTSRPRAYYSGILPRAASSSAVSFIQSHIRLLPWLSNVDAPGRLNGTLYDVLQRSLPSGSTAEISAAGLDVTCGFPSNLPVTTVPVSQNASCYNGMFWTVNLTISSNETTLFTPYLLGPNLLTVVQDVFASENIWSDSLSFYTANPVVDSTGTAGHRLELVAPPEASSSNYSLQFLQCSWTLVPQRAQADSASRRVITRLPPDLYGTGRHLMERLNLSPSWIKTGDASSPGSVLYLHDIENAVVDMIASIFWMTPQAGKICRPPSSWLHLAHLGIAQRAERSQRQSGAQPPNLSYANSSVSTVCKTLKRKQELAKPKEWALTHAAMQWVEYNSYVHPWASKVSTGLGASIALFIFSIGFTLRGSKTAQGPISLGLLQVFWILAYNPRLRESLEQVTHPMQENLRAAGMALASGREFTCHQYDRDLGISGSVDGVPKCGARLLTAEKEPLKAYARLYFSMKDLAEHSVTSRSVQREKFDKELFPIQVQSFRKTPKIRKNILRRGPVKNNLHSTKTPSSISL
ncbi:hypothetical protein B0H19DRAFT_1077661 [Mycena capillaripes]|nr:hypothetical protein B0H19DRAFT_1077661 [Mycena capillaripes]